MPAPLQLPPIAPGRVGPRREPRRITLSAATPPPPRLAEERPSSSRWAISLPSLKSLHIDAPNASDHFVDSSGPSWLQSAEALPLPTADPPRLSGSKAPLDGRPPVKRVSRAHQAARREAATVTIQRVFRGHRCKQLLKNPMQRHRECWQEMQVVERLEHVERQGIRRAWMAAIYDLEEQRNATAAEVHNLLTVRKGRAALVLQRVARGWRARRWFRSHWPTLLTRWEARERKCIRALEVEAVGHFQAMATQGGRLAVRQWAAVLIQRRVRGHLARQLTLRLQEVREQCASLEMEERQQRRALAKMEGTAREKWNLRSAPRRSRALP
eukprot:GGOE01036988.1.p1 GENE.GGOE01036988.1~~GGOE01036988.1.p1  ORF type:complete len:327 (-),score=43.29 GGOE01036988.1:190-1170(-)